MVENFETGNIYEIDGSEYILGRYRRGDKDFIVLIGLADGNRFVEPVKVKSFCDITRDEFNKACAKKQCKLIGNAQEILSKNIQS